MNTPRTPRLAADANERGTITVFTAIVVAALLLMVGLALDGGQKIRAARQADAIAAEAARAGGQAIKVPDAVQGQQPVIDPQAAVRASKAFLRTAGVTGSVQITGPSQLTVRVTIHRPTLLLPLIGIDEVTAHGKATARLARGITQEDR